MDNIQDEVPIQIQFEFLNVNKEIELSKKYTVNFLCSEDLEINRLNILNSCDFRTQEERIYYYFFNAKTKIFLIKNTDIINYYKQNKVVIMKNCKIFADQICEKLKVKTLKYKNNKETLDELKKCEIIDLKKIKIILILRYLEHNFQVDLFAEEFIVNNGLHYLEIIIQHKTENKRIFALKGLRKLLDFKTACIYFEKNIQFLSILYDIIMSNETINGSLISFDIIIKIIGNNKEKITYIIDVAEKYAKNTNTKIFSQIVNFLKESNKEKKLQYLSLFFINIIINNCVPNKLHTILGQLRDLGIFEILDKPREYEKKFEEQVEIFNNKTKIYRKEIK